jgi:hypothetical protein
MTSAKAQPQFTALKRQSHAVLDATTRNTNVVPSAGSSSQDSGCMLTALQPLSVHQMHKLVHYLQQW